MAHDVSFNGFRFAELGRGESLCSPDVCDCCGREDLKKTVKLINPEGRVVWFGVGCAARAMGCKPLVVRHGRQDAIDALASAERRERYAIEQAEDDRWQAWLDSVVPALASKDPACRGANRCRQIDALGGWTAARAGYKAVSS